MHTNPHSKGSSEARLTRWSKQHPTIKRNRRYRTGRWVKNEVLGINSYQFGTCSLDGHDRLDPDGMTRSKRYNYTGRR